MEAIETVTDQSRGSALGVFTAFLDLAMGITGPIAAFIVGKLGYLEIFLYGSGAAACALVLTIFLYRLVRERRASRRALGLLEA